MPGTARRFRAFTLIELLVVISILALLLAILIPSFFRVIKSARRMTCFSHMGSIGNGITGYTSNNMTLMPFDWTQGDWANLIVPYFDGDAKVGDGTISVACQPFSRNYYENNDLNPNTGRGRGIVLSKRMNCPDQPMTCASRRQWGEWQPYDSSGGVPNEGDHRYDRHYFNPLYSPAVRVTDFPADRFAALIEPRLDDAIQHNWHAFSNSTTFWNVEAYKWLPYMPHDASRPPPSVTLQQICQGTRIPGWTATPSMNTRPDNPSMNTTFMDGHVETWTYQQMVNWIITFPSQGTRAQGWPPFFSDKSYFLP